MAKKNIKRKSFFITIEGSEGSGKSSVIAYLQRTFIGRNYSIKIFREPGSTKIGEKIRTILLDKKNSNLSAHTELLLYLAARTQLIEEKLTKALAKYDVVICDRYFDSTLVYQGAALGLGSIVEKSVEMFCLGVVPDLTIILDAPVSDGLKRLKKRDRIESRPLAFHKKLRAGYLKLAKKYPKRIKIVDARGKLDLIYERVEKLLCKVFLKLQ
jgi:dTMP kinase